MKAMQVFVLAGLAAATSVYATTKTITLPPDGVQLEPSELPGYAKARANCMTCHSAEYMRYQPLNAPRTYWEAMVKRMKAVFMAPIDDADMPDIVDYLVKTYGAERPRAFNDLDTQSTVAMRTKAPPSRSTPRTNRRLGIDR